MKTSADPLLNNVGSIIAFLKYNNFLLILVFLMKKNSCPCVVRLGLSHILHSYPKSCVFIKSLLGVEVDVFMHFFNQKQNKLAPAKCLVSDSKPLDKYFIWIREKEFLILSSVVFLHLQISDWKFGPKSYFFPRNDLIK